MCSSRAGSTRAGPGGRSRTGGWRMGGGRSSAVCCPDLRGNSCSSLDLMTVTSTVRRETGKKGCRGPFTQKRAGEAPDFMDTREGPSGPGSCIHGVWRHPRGRGHVCAVHSQPPNGPFWQPCLSKMAGALSQNGNLIWMDYL